MYKVGDTVLVIRYGAILPRDIAKKAGGLRYFKDYSVKRLVLRGYVSDCIVLDPQKTLSKGMTSKYNIGSLMGKDLSEMIGVRGSSKYKAYFKAKKDSIWKPLKRLSEMLFSYK